MGTSASILFITLLASAPAAPGAWPDQVIVHQASALVKPCRESAEAYFREQDDEDRQVRLTESRTFGAPA